MNILFIAVSNNKERAWSRHIYWIHSYRSL